MCSVVNSLLTGIDLVEYLMNNHLLVATEFDEKLHQYFSGNDSDTEVRIVRFVQQTIRDVKIAEKYFEGNPEDLLSMYAKKL